MGIKPAGCWKASHFMYMLGCAGNIGVLYDRRLCYASGM